MRREIVSSFVLIHRVLIEHLLLLETVLRAGECSRRQSGTMFLFP